MTTAALPAPTVAAGAVWSDDELAEAVRAGDTGAFAVLYDRHLAACLRFARYLGAQPEIAQDVVAESFTRVFVQLLRGRGPTAAFRSYVFSAVRANLCNAVRRDHRQDLADDPADFVHAEGVDEPVGELLESMMLARAFAALPQRWQMVLWHIEVEGKTAASLAEPLGMSANAVAALTYRAREGLRAAYLQAHLHENGDPACAAYVPKLSPWLRRRLPAQEHRAIDAHLRGCARCSAAVAELADLAAGLNRAHPPGRRVERGRPVAGGVAVLVLLVLVTALATLRPSRTGPDLHVDHFGPAGSGGLPAPLTTVEPTAVDVLPSGTPASPTPTRSEPVAWPTERFGAPSAQWPPSSAAPSEPDRSEPPPVDQEPVVPEPVAPPAGTTTPGDEPLPPSPSDTPSGETGEPAGQDGSTCAGPTSSPPVGGEQGSPGQAVVESPSASPSPQPVAPECPETTRQPDVTPAG